MGKRHFSLGKIISSLLSLLGLFYLITLGSMKCMEHWTQDRNEVGTPSVGLLEMDGVILDSWKTLKQLEEFEENDQIRAVVFRLNSPGGAVAPSQEIYEAVKKFKKPIVVSMGSTAASGAFYIAMGARKILANPGTLTGSIGLIMEFTNLEKLYEWAKVQRYSIKTGKYKDAGSDYRALDSEERALFQNMANDILEQFQEAVSESRKIPIEQVKKIADGRVFSGRQALHLGLIDELGTLQDAILAAGKLGGIVGKPPLFEPRKKRHWLQLLQEVNEPGYDSQSALFKKGLQVLTRDLPELLEPSPRLTGPLFLWK